MEIDLDKAPKGATHYKITGDNRPPLWATMSEGPFGALWRGGSWDFLIEPLKSEGWMKITPQWNGEGLPPVGTVCEINHPELGWTRCDIVAHKVMGCGGKTHAIAWIDGNTLDQSQGLRFRPIRTPEQIAAEERSAGIQAILDDYTYTVGPCTHKLAMSQAERLYDAGYRKQVAQ